MATVTTIYTADVVDAATLYGFAQLDFTTWSAEGTWKGEAEASRVWRHIGSRIESRLFVAAMKMALGNTEEQYIFVTKQELDSELVQV